MQNRISIIDIVYNYCIDNIKNGTWKPGEKIPSENQLSQTLEVSKVSIRSAMQKLRALGIIVTKQGKGSVISINADSYMIDNKEKVINLTNKDLLDISEFREAVELKALELALIRGTESDIHKIEEAYIEMENSLSDYRKYSKADLKFHLAIMKASQNKILYQSAIAIKDEYFLYFEELNRMFGKGDELENSLKGHKEMLLAIKNRDFKTSSESISHAIHGNKEKIEALDKFKKV